MKYVSVLLVRRFGHEGESLGTAPRFGHAGDRLHCQCSLLSPSLNDVILGKHDLLDPWKGDIFLRSLDSYANLSYLDCEPLAGRFLLRSFQN
jgi:hypothetical protein